MSPPLPRPSVSSRAGTTPGRTAARTGKIAAATQRKREREKLLAVVARSREPTTSDKAHAHQHRAAPSTPSSVDRASRVQEILFVRHPCSTERRRWLLLRRSSTILIMFALPANSVDL